MKFAVTQWNEWDDFDFQTNSVKSLMNTIFKNGWFKSNNMITNFPSYLVLLLAIYESNRLPDKKIAIPKKNKYFSVLNISRYTQNIPNNTNIPRKNIFNLVNIK